MRGEVTSQSLFFILGAIIVIASLFFGAALITRQASEQSKSKLFFFEQDVSRQFGTYSFDSLSINEYSLPSGYTEICFVDLLNVEPNDIENPLIKDSVKDGVIKNVFIFGEGMETFNIESLSLGGAPYYFCTQNKFTLESVGRGDRSELRMPLNEAYCQAAQDNTPTNGDFCSALDITYGDSYKERCCDAYGLCCG